MPPKGGFYGDFPLSDFLIGIILMALLFFLLIHRA